jgi:hypothetical protein
MQYGRKRRMNGLKVRPIVDQLGEKNLSAPPALIPFLFTPMVAYDI